MMNTIPTTTQNVQNVINSVATSVASETESSLGQNNAFFFSLLTNDNVFKTRWISINISKFSNTVNSVNTPLL